MNGTMGPIGPKGPPGVKGEKGDSINLKGCRHQRKVSDLTRGNNPKTVYLKAPSQVRTSQALLPFGTMQYYPR